MYMEHAGDCLFTSAIFLTLGTSSSGFLSFRTRTAAVGTILSGLVIIRVKGTGNTELVDDVIVGTRTALAWEHTGEKMCGYALEGMHSTMKPL